MGNFSRASTIGLLLLMGCNGVSHIPAEAASGSRNTSGGTVRSECGEGIAGLSPGPSPIRRLNRREYDATVLDLLGDTTDPSRDFPEESRALGFDTGAETQTATSLLVEAYQEAAGGISFRATVDLPRLLGCTPTDSACIDSFIQRFGTKAYRRPIRTEEARRLRETFDWGNDKQSVRDGLRMVIEVVLQSPEFLYRPEFGADVAAPGVVRLSSYEMATRLSYLFLGSPPDSILEVEAKADRLRTADQVRTQAERLLDAPRSQVTFQSFHDQWLDLESISRLDRDPTAYAGYTDSIPALLRQETQSLIDYVLWKDDARLETLLTAPYTFVNPELADFYGLPAPSGAAFAQVANDPAQRLGLLTQGGLLAVHARPLQSSPVLRGKFVRETLLCQPLEPPPDDLTIKAPELDPTLTTRERFAQHTANPACAACHRQTDPIGFGFEHFDAVGRYRESENGHSIDASGEVGDSDLDGPFEGAVELAQKLAGSEQVADCFVKNWIRYAYGRGETDADACTLARVKAGFAADKHDIRRLVVQLTQTDAFLYRNTVTQ